MNNNTTTNTKRKRNVNPINWPNPDNYFIMDDMVKLNPDVVPITLKVRFAKILEEKNVAVVIGNKTGGKGRPKLVYAMTPVQKEVIEKAQSDGVMIVGENELVRVLDISPLNDTPPVSPETVSETVNETVNSNQKLQAVN